MLYRELTRALRQRFNISDQAIQSENEMALLINGELKVYFESDAETQGLYYLYSTLGTLPLTNQKNTFIEILQGNLLYHETSHSAIGYHRDSGELYLFQAIHLNKIELKAFLLKLKDFINTHKNWSSKLQKKYHCKIEKDSHSNDLDNLAHLKI